LSSTRDAEAAKGFFLKALHSCVRSSASSKMSEEKMPGSPLHPDHCSPQPLPRVINTDKNAAYPKAVADLKASGVLSKEVELRQVKYLNNIVEQDHRFIKRLVKPGMGFFSFATASRTLQGYEMINMLRKGQMHGVRKGDSRSQVAFIASLFGAVA
jgi:IS6 family transposase